MEATAAGLSPSAHARGGLQSKEKEVAIAVVAVSMIAIFRMAIFRISGRCPFHRTLIRRAQTVLALPIPHPEPDGES